MCQHRQRSHWAWGYEDELTEGGELRELATLIAGTLGFGSPDALEEPVPRRDIPLRAPRVEPPARLAPLCVAAPDDRLVHANGQAYRDVIAAMRGDLPHVPDLVAYPRGEDDVAALLDWCEDSGVALVPYGGGTSVVGGVEPRFDGPSVTCDTSRMNRVLEVDATSRAARIEAGARGPDINAELAAHGLTLRHYPQSFELSTLGGWIATRSGGHYATLYTHIDDLVESVRALTPRGPWESRRVPGSGAGVSPDRMLLGSEGILGVITSAWVRVQQRPRYRASASVRFDGFDRGAAAVREICQAGLYPAQCRLLDATEAALTAGGDGGHALLVLGFESADLRVRPALDRALEIAAAHTGEWDEPSDTDQGDRSGSWRSGFTRAPYLRNTFVRMGVLSETFETAITWDRWPAFHETVTAAVAAAAREASGPAAEPIVTCRFAFCYPDGPAPYYTVLAPARRGGEIEQWDTIKRAAADALLAAGGTITHHHAIGRDHRAWYERQRPEPFAAALGAAKRGLDPQWVLNPGVLVGRGG